MTSVTDFVPEWASAPGASIKLLMSEKAFSLEELAAACNLKPRELSKVISGDLAITMPLASALAATIGGSSRFWLNRQRRFEEQANLVATNEWVQTLPLRSMRKLGWLDAPRDWRPRIDACLEFFAVETVKEWQQLCESDFGAVRFRTSQTYSDKLPAVATWLRQAEKKHEQRTLSVFDRTSLSTRVEDLRSLCREPDPENFIPQISRLLEECGVSFQVLPAPEGCTASGASRLMRDGAGSVVLSGRFLTDDQFWFSLFHEIGHLLLHDETALHVDGDPELANVGNSELEADTFAADVLWPVEERPLVVSEINASRRAVVRLAATLRVSPGILVGQLQHLGVLAHSELNYLKRRYQRDGTTLRLRKKRAS